MSDERVRFGLIGAGAWGRCHAQAIATRHNTELAAVADPSEESRKAVSEKHPNAEVFEDYHQLLERGDIEAVDIVVPSHLHYDAASAALSKGKHVLLEKPMAITVADCEKLVRLAEKRDLRLSIGHELRLSSLWGKVKSLIDEGVIGAPKYALVELLRKPYRLGSGGWRFDINRVGNWILEEPIHFFDLARWYLASQGAPSSVYAVANSRQEGHPELQDNFSAIMNFEGGAYAVISQTLAAFEHHQTVKITGTKGALWASWSGAMDRVRKAQFFLKVFDGENLEEVSIKEMAGELFELESEIELMAGTVRNGTPLAATGTDGMWSVAMCEAAVRSVEAGRPIAMESVF